MAMLRKLAVAVFLAGAGAAVAHDGAATGTPLKCSRCVDWNRLQQPFQVAGNTWYVGTSELSALLITSPQGHILLDGALPQSASIIEQNIQTLGFRIEDVKLILNSHAHFDHAGALAALQHASGALVAASAHGAKVLKDGTIGKDDPQYDAQHPFRIPKLAHVKAVGDGETLKVGTLAVTAHLTPGHTPGSTTWTWKSCVQDRCLDVVYADSLNAVSADDFYFSGRGKSPDLSASFRASIDKVAALKCDVLLSVHPEFSGIMKKRAAQTASRNPFIDAGGCRAYAADARARLETRLAKEKEAPINR